jgi:exopolysaccharide biosynthesis polyprenyl glycosylphosphotransferase
MNFIGHKKYWMALLQFSLDLIWVTASFFTAYLLKRTIILPDPYLNLDSYVKLFIIVLPFLMGSLYFSHHYSLRVIMLPWMSWVKITSRTVLTMFIVLVVLSFYIKIFSYSRAVFTLFFFLVFVFLVISRAIFNWFCIKPMLIRDKLFHRVILFTDHNGEDLVRKLERGLGCSVEKVHVEADQELTPVTINKIRQGEIGGVFIDLSSHRIEDVTAILCQAEKEGVPVYMTKRIIPRTNFNISLEILGDQPVIAYNPKQIPLFGKILKRSLDIVTSILTLIFLSPLILLVALGIRMSSPGPIIYRQSRVGFGGSLFIMYKFRTMVAGAEEDTGPVWAEQDDPRVTKIGRFLRRTNLDELPQLFNVLLGKMSLVGPRPERPEFVRQFKEKISRYNHKHWVKPGITGWAQINGWRGNTSLAERIKCDLYYVENWSLWIDLKILFLTLFKAYKNAM